MFLPAPLRVLKAFVNVQIAQWDSQGQGDGAARLDNSPQRPGIVDARRSSAELHPFERLNAMLGF